MSATLSPAAMDAVEATIGRMRALVAELQAEADKARREVAVLKKENAQLWESIHERDSLIRELEDMNVRGRCDQ